MGILLPLATLLMSISSSTLSDSCQVQLTQVGQNVTVTGAVDPTAWISGTYQMNVTVIQGSNRSVSSQSGQFSTKEDHDSSNAGFHKLSTTTVYAGPGGRVSITLTVRDEMQTQECTTTETLG